MIYFEYEAEVGATVHINREDDGLTLTMTPEECLAMLEALLDIEQDLHIDLVTKELENGECSGT